MTLQQLKYIVTVAETGNITEAARRLFISQPSLTNAIRELETEMQITIFNRTNKGVMISNEGDLFLSYARQTLEQANLLEEKFKNIDKQSPRFSVSCQHYSFAVNAFVNVIRKFDANKYDFTLRETQTHEIIEDVSRLRSEIGILYTSSKNEEIILKMVKQNGLEFEELFVAKPHVFICANHPLAGREVLDLKDLEEYPYLSFEQGEYNSFYFSEEILSKEGIHYIMALRGDRPQTMSDEQFNSREFLYASDRIRYLKANTSLSIAGACYPEKHYEAASFESDLSYLKEKVEAGASFLVTQLFFDNDMFYRFRERAAALEITVPICAGIMSVISAKQISKSINLAGSSIPKELENMIAAYGKNKEDMRKAGIDYAVRQILDLKEHGVDGIHIYTMNWPKTTAEIVAQISI